ncbi:MAG: DUF362 domain-containing protein [Candidatus Odinarchaeota archaeon]|nr:DUF362 domain-containing protein [Candidatus Odinarchaeota archaeon]
MNNFAKVSVVKCLNLFNDVEKALKLIDAEKAISRSEKILIKPNYIIAEGPDYVHVTDPRIIKALIIWLKNMGVDDIIIAEGGLSTDTADRAFKITGLTKTAEKYGVKLVNLNKDKFVKVKIPDPYDLREVNIAKTVLEADCIINVPKLKIHHIAGVTLCAKNLMGCISPKGIMHINIHKKLADLASIIRPCINIVDGIIGSEGNEISGDPVKMNIIIAGLDIVATDTISCIVMGIDPKKPEYLQLMSKKGLGTCDLNKIKVLGENLIDIIRNFRLAYGFEDWRLKGPLNNLLK